MKHRLQLSVLRNKTSSNNKYIPMFIIRRLSHIIIEDAVVIEIHEYNHSFQDSRFNIQNTLSASHRKKCDIHHGHINIKYQYQ